MRYNDIMDGFLRVIEKRKKESSYIPIKKSTENNEKPISAIPDKNPVTEATPKICTKNSVARPLKNQLSQEQQKSRLQRLAQMGFGPQDCLKIIESTKNLTDADFEKRAKFLELLPRKL